LAERKSSLINEEVLREANVVRGRYAAVLSDARLFTRFLCGVTSPRLSRAKLTSHSLFGALSHVPFVNLLARFNSVPR
jgi:ATP-dependent DNA helicase RecQ